MAIKPKIIIFSFICVIAAWVLIAIINEQIAKNLDGNLILNKAETSMKALDPKGALKQIKLALKNSDIHVRVKAIEMLESFSDPAELEILLKAAQDKNSSMRTSAAKVLGKKHGQGIIKTLKTLLLDSDNSVATAAYQSLLSMEQIPKGSLGFSLKNSSIFSSKYAGNAFLDEGDSKAVPILLEMLKEDDVNVLTEAVAIIFNKHFQNTEVVKPLRELLDKKKDYCLDSMLAGFKNIETASTSELLDNAFDEQEVNLLVSVISTIGKTGDINAMEQLYEAMCDARWDDLNNKIRTFKDKNKDRYAKKYTAQVQKQAELIRAGGTQALSYYDTQNSSTKQQIVEMLLRLLAASKQESKTRFIIKQLTSLQEIRTIGPIIDAGCKMSGYDTFASSAFRAQEISKAETLKYLIGIVSDQGNENRICAIGMLAKLGDLSCVDALMVSLKDKDSHVRAASVHALGLLKATKAVDALIEALEDEVESVTDEVLAALGAIRYSRAVEPIVNAIQKRKVNPLAGVTALYNITGKRWDYLLRSPAFGSSQESSDGEPSQQRPARLKVNAYPAQ